MLHVLFKGTEKMNKSKDGHATVALMCDHSRARGGLLHRLWGWMELKKASLGLRRLLSQ